MLTFDYNAHKKNKNNKNENNKNKRVIGIAQLC